MSRIKMAEKGKKTLQELFKFKTLKCKTCNKIYYECPLCFSLVKRFGPHHCTNQWAENMLEKRTLPVFGCNTLCPRCMIEDGCQHQFEEM